MKLRLGTRTLYKGFTVVELMAVITVIAILVTISVVAYNGLTGRATDNVVISDAESLEALQTQYALQNETGGKSWFSGNGIDQDLSFTVSDGIIVDAVANSRAFCIRSFSPASNSYQTLYTAYTVESSPGACIALPPSQDAINADAQAAPSGWTSISAGDEHTCAIAADERAYCWGNGPSGQMGTSLSGGSSNQLNPLPVLTNGVTNGKSIRSVVASGSSSCSIDTDNVAYCWGADLYGERGDGIINDGIPQVGPQPVQTSGALAGKTIKKLAANPYGRHTCVLASDDMPYCWGYNYYGQLGYGAYMGTGHSGSPVAISTAGAMAGQTAKDIASGHTHNCVLAEDNRVYCWGFNNQGQLGNGATGNVINPAVAVSTAGVLNNKSVIAVALGYLSSCALTSEGLVACWGLNSSGQLGNGTTTGSSSPVSVSMTGELAGKKFRQISGGYSHMCGITTDNLGYCWGLNTSGQLGNASSTNSSVPVPVNRAGQLSGKQLKSISAGDTHSCAVATDHTAYCWGSNANGRFGNGTLTSSNVPVAVNLP